MENRKSNRVIEKIIKRNVAIAMLIGLFTNIGFGEIILNPNANQNTTIDRSQNGAATIININTPNSKNISVNDFQEFRTKDGVVFNNFGEGVGRSYLAGLMAANPNLTREQAAQLILNRVGGNNRVEIENYLEVMSNGKTDMIFSSPNGFYLNNTGFINFKDVMFTTSNVNLDANGNIMPFNIRGGDISIGREGINAEGVRYLALLSQKINIDGQINGSGADVDLIAGNFDYNPTTKQYANQGVNNNELLISSSAFGSIYGNQIKIVALNGNVGVMGDVIGERVVRINADGTIVTNRTQAKDGIEIVGKEYTQNTSTYTEGNLTINADKVTLNGNGAQAKDIYVTGDVNNNNTIYAKGNVKIDGNTKSTGQIITEKSLTIGKDLDSEELVYGAEAVSVGGNLNNKDNLQTEGNVTVAGDTNNQGKIVAGNNLDIKGNLNNLGTAYGETSVVIGKDLNNTGSLQSTGDVSAQNTVNTGKVISEKNITVKNLDNSGEVTANQKITASNIDNKTTGKINAGDTIISNGNAINQGSVRTNGSFNISGNYANYNETLVGGDLNSRDIFNSGSMKVSEKITGRGTFTNTGEILASNLDVDTLGNISNTNKIVVLEDSKLKGANITNSGYLSSTNIELETPTLINSGRIEADNKISANNTNLNNVTGGYIGSNQKLELNNSNILNQGTLESNSIELQNLFGYNNTGLIRGNDVVLTSIGNLTLTGTLHGENYLQINGLDISNNGVTTGTGYIEIKGRDITNNTELASDIIVIEGTGNVINNNIITGEDGRIIGFNITNNDLIAFSGQLGLKATNKITNSLGKAIYGGELLDLEFGDLENNRGELLSLNTINLRGNYLLNKVGTIQSSGDININVTKIDNIGEVTGLNDYEVYYETWDGQKYTEAEFNSSWAFGKEENAGSNAGRVNHFNSILNIANLQGGYNSLLDYYYGAEIRSRFVTDGEFGVAVSDTQMYPGESIKGKVKSNAITTYGNILAGTDINITANELNNIDGKISAGERAELNVTTLKNNTTLGAAIILKDGYEEVEWHGINSSTRPVRYRRLIKTGDTSYITGQASVIEARNLILNTGTLILTPEIDTASQIVNGSSTSGIAGDITKTTSTGTSNTSGIVNIVKNMDPLTEIKTSGILPIDPLSAKSSLFTTSTDQTSKYLLETRSKYINLASFYGSDYFLSRLGYDESSEWNRARRLGDAYYEYLIVTRAISDKLGTRFINGLSDKELMKAMLDNSVDVQKDLQLTVGVSLTKDQVKALKSDIIWYEYEVVDGQKVLVPKVYLSQTTLASIEVDGRNKIGGLELTAINADEIRNNGQLIGNGGVTYVNAGKVYNVTNTNELSEIKGNQVTVIATKGNIENIGGRIKGIESVVLSAENGDIINSSSKVTSVLDKGEFHKSTNDKILSVGSIESEGTTYIEGKNYLSEAGVVTGKNTIIDAKENITIGSMALNGEDKFGTNKDNFQYYKGTQYAGSEVSGTDSVILNANNDINVRGSMIGSDGTVQLTAENINIVNEKETRQLDSKSKVKRTLSSTESEMKSYQEGAVGSTIVGNNVILDAKNDINIKASNVIAVKDGIENTGGNIIATAGNNINILAETLDNSYYSKVKSSGFDTNFSSGGGGITAGVSYNKNSLEQQSNGTTVAISTLVSEGSTVLDAGNKVRTEAMQANIGEDLIIKGKNGVELLDAKETFEEKVKQKSSSIGVSVSAGFTPAQMVSTVSDISNNIKDYGFGNASQTINTLGNGFQDLRNISALTGNLRSWYEADGYIGAKGLVTDGLNNPVSGGNNLKDAAKGLVSASVTASYSQSSYESNTSGTKSVAGVINVGGNMVVQSEGDVRFVNQKITVGENIIIDAKNFEALAGENTYKNDTKSNSMGINAGYDIVNNNALGGLNASAGNSNTTSKSYDNTFISAGGTFQLTTKEDATFKGANVIADKINFDIGKNLNIISLQDEYKTHGESSNVGINVSGKLPGTEFQSGTASPSFGGGYSQNNGESKWVSNQTSIIAENGGSIKVNETLTNIGAIVGSLSDENKLSIDTKNLVIGNLEDYNRGENSGAQISGIGGKTPAPQTSIQYGSHDKEQNTNATFVNTEVTENGVKLDLDKLGINTDIAKAQVVTKDEVVDQINTTLHTDLINTTTRNQVIMDINGLINLPGDVIKAALAVDKNEGSNFLDNLVGTLRSTDSDMNNTLTMKDKYKKFNENKDLTNEEKAAGALMLANDSANGLRETFGIDKDTPMLILFADESKGQEAGAFYKEDGSLLIFLDPSKIDMSNSKEVYNGLMYEMNHFNPSNPYTYNQSEKNVSQGYGLEEDFTSIGRKPISGNGNSFYDEVMKGSSILTVGNEVYGRIDKNDLDYAPVSSNEAENDFIRKMKACGPDLKCQQRLSDAVGAVVKKEEKTKQEVKPKPGDKGFIPNVVYCDKPCKIAEEKKEANALAKKSEKEGVANAAKFNEPYNASWMPSPDNGNVKLTESELRNAITTAGTANTMEHIVRFDLLDQLYNTSSDFKNQVDAMSPYTRTKADAMNMAMAGLGVEDAKEFQKNVGYVSMATNFIPVYGEYKMMTEAIMGRDLLSGKELSFEERALIGLGINKGILELGNISLKPKETTNTLTNPSQEVSMVTADGKVVKVKVDVNNSSILNPEYLYHYTNEKGLNGILESEKLFPSLKANNPKDARYGNGQYLSDIAPYDTTPMSLSSKFINVPNKYKYTNYIKIDVKGLEVIEGRNGVFLIPNESILNIRGRIIEYGNVGGGN
ncbi:MAG: hemagglutinin repeat-containing protein [Sebaldella sp.]|nr:hemagglutinin repeat-containing protein [Sebaldella sp.]